MTRPKPLDVTLMREPSVMGAFACRRSELRCRLEEHRVADGGGDQLATHVIARSKGFDAFWLFRRLDGVQEISSAGFGN
jgi:hypothetical protein